MIITSSVLRTASILLVVAAATPAPCRAQSAENVALVINESSAASQQIGEHYFRSRAIPPGNVIRIKTAADDAIARGRYVAEIESPIATAIGRESLQDRILYIVLTKGVPLRIAGTGGQDGTASSVDSELTLLYRRMTGQSVATAGYIANPYFLGSREISEAKPFTHREHDIYLVTRLDAFNPDEAAALVDRAQKPSAEGVIVLDQRVSATGPRSGDE